jgi:hypothetical protein
MSDRREKLKRLGRNVLHGVKRAGIAVLKYGIPLAAAATVGHHIGELHGRTMALSEASSPADTAALYEADINQGREQIKQLKDQLQQHNDTQALFKKQLAAQKFQTAYLKHKNNKLVKAYEIRATHQDEKYTQLQQQYGDLQNMYVAARDAAAAAEEAKSKPRLHNRLREALPF